MIVCYLNESVRIGLGKWSAAYALGGPSIEAVGSGVPGNITVYTILLPHCSLQVLPQAGDGREGQNDTPVCQAATSPSREVTYFVLIFKVLNSLAKS